MSQIITIQNSITKEIIANGIPIPLEGNYYFDKSDVNLELLTKKDNIYHCPIKNADADYYYLVENQDSEVGWCYESVKTSLFESIAGKIGFYGKNRLSIDVKVEDSNN